MFMALLGRFKLPLAIGAISLLAVGFMYVRMEHYANQAEKYLQERNVATERANRLAETIIHNERQFQLQLDDIQSQRDTLREVNETLAAAVNRDREIITEIYDAPEEDDAPVAPVLRRALERLRGKPAGADASAED